MAKKIFVLNGVKYTTKKAVADKCREILYGYPNGATLGAEDFRFMLDLLGHHEDAEQKIGCGVECMFVAQNVVYPTKGFYLRRVDGTETDFSFNTCMTQSTHEKDCRKAARVAIVDSIMRCKNEFFAGNQNPVCEVTGETLTVATCHVDHKPPMTFQALWKEFLEVMDVEADSLGLIKHGDGQIFEQFSSAEFRRLWVEFHDSRANLRVISIKANLSLPKE